MGSDGVEIMNQREKVEQYFIENRGSDNMGTAIYRKQRMLSKIPAGNKIHKYHGHSFDHGHLKNQRQLSKNAHLTRILKVGKHTTTKRHGTGKKARTSRKLKQATMLRKLRYKNKDVRKLTGRDKKRVLGQIYTERRNRR